MERTDVWHVKTGEILPAIVPFDEKYITYGVRPGSVGQYTGLKDKNGTEIYEGDVVKVLTNCNSDLHGSWCLKNIIYRNGAWVAEYVSSETGRKLPLGYTAVQLTDEQFYGGWDKDHVLEDGFDKLFETEVIGNIYENPELLEA